MKTISVCLLGLTWISSTLADEMPPAIRYAEHAARSYELETLKFQLEMLQAGRESAGEELAPEEEEWFAGGILKRQIRQAELVTEEVRASRVIIDCGLGVDRKDEPLPPLPPMLTGRILDTRKNFVEISTKF